jgi:hypothetical protein
MAQFECLHHIVSPECRALQLEALAALQHAEWLTNALACGDEFGR